ncbi:MAG TPA: energy transducer TonB [Candidatus Angelobacter sp.]|nr:energy transducer TonB [Candidatus Angelobacter sp.]
MPYQRQILLSTRPVPGWPMILLSASGHVAAVVSLVVLLHATAIHFVPPQYETVQIISGSAHLSYNPPRARSAQTAPLLLPHAPPRSRVVSNGTAPTGKALEVLREHAQSATAGMIDSIRVSQFYGFHSDDYKLAIHTAGEFPHISAAELPPHFEQLVTVEVTIDTVGHVADARIVGGEVSAPIQRKLLAAVREFRYIPATHYGSPIPSQLDLIIHVPTIDAG